LSKIEKIFPNKSLIITVSGNLYQVIGEGQKSQVQIIDFQLLRHGFSPEQITQLNLASNGFFHWNTDHWKQNPKPPQPEKI